MLIFFRVLQGIGGGGMAPSEQAILADTFPPEKRAQAFALYGIAVIVAPAIGPTLGGWITDNFSWHWIFFINVPVGVLSLALVQWLRGRARGARAERRERLARRPEASTGSASCWSRWRSAASRSCSTRGSEDDWFASSFIIAFATAVGDLIRCCSCPGS